MFETLSERLNGVFRGLGNKGRLTEKDVDAALREIRMALLEADVNFRVARNFVGKIRERSLGEDVLRSLTPGQQVVKITNEELTAVLGGGIKRLEPAPKPPSVVLMVGLNGSGKTTMTGKLARRLKRDSQSPLMVAADLQRPAAIQQLQTLGKQIDVPVHHEDGRDTPKVAAAGVRRAAEMGASWALVDTAGRFQVDDDLMSELEAVRDAVEPTETLLVVDAMTGQDAVAVAQEFHDRIGLTGLVLTKLDGERARRRRNIHSGRDGRADQVHRHGRAAGRTGGVPPRPAGVPHPRHGGHAHAHREGPGLLRRGTRRSSSRRRFGRPRST